MKRQRRLLQASGELVQLRDAVLRAVSLVVTDRRWAAPLSAMALGFGLFLGVAIGPGTDGSLATGAGQIIALAEEEEPEGAEGGREPNFSSSGSEAESVESEPSEPAYEPEYAPEPVAEPVAEEEPASEEPAEKEFEEEGEAQQLKGTVAHANPGAGSYTMAIAGGELVSVHAPKLPLPGEKLTVEAVPLPNNTFAEDERERAGTAKGAELRGVVTHVDADPADPNYTLSGRGSSILVHVPPSPAPLLPSLGAYATVGAAVEKPLPAETPPAEAPGLESTATCLPAPTLNAAPAPNRILVQRALETEPEPATYVDLAGIVTAVCPETGQLLISADDLRAGEDDLVLSVPARFRTGELEIGESVVATATVGEDGTLTLAGLASDEGRRGAEDDSSAQGDLKR